MQKPQLLNALRNFIVLENKLNNQSITSTILPKNPTQGYWKES